MKLFTKPGCVACVESICDECDGDDLFTRNEVQRAKVIIASSRDALQVHHRLRREVLTEEVLQRIDRATKTLNQTTYIAYRLEFIARKP
jgi:hypothetical protein